MVVRVGQCELGGWDETEGEDRMVRVGHLRVDRYGRWRDYTVLWMLLVTCTPTPVPSLATSPVANPHHSTFTGVPHPHNPKHPQQITYHA